MSRKIETNIKVKKLNIIIEFTEHVISRNKKQQSNSGMEIPDYAIERIARCLLPIMQEYFESEEVPPAFLLQPQKLISRIKIKNPNPLPIGIKFGFLQCGGH